MKIPTSLPLLALLFSSGSHAACDSLLDFETMHGSMLYYRPPLRNEGFMQRLHFLDKIGDRWWPMMAAVYLLVAKKRVVGVTPLPLSWKTKRAIAGGAAQPAARGMILPFHRKQ